VRAVIIAAASAAVAVAQLPPPPGMARAKDRTVQCPRTVAKFSVSIAANSGPFSIDAADNKQYASISIDNEDALVRTDGCRITRAPALRTSTLGRRWTVQQRHFEIKQFGCTYRGPLVVRVQVVRSGSRFVNRISIWSNRGRQFAHGELADGRGWLRVARACSLTYSR
jgi:hypothetical protein